LYAQNWLKIETSFFATLTWLSGRGFSPLSPPLVAPLEGDKSNCEVV